MTSIFITRDIDEAVWKSALPTSVTVHGQSLLHIEPLAFDMPAADWVFFYSKNGVRHFFDRYAGQLQPYRWAAMGPATAAKLAEYVIEVDLIGDGTPAGTAAALDLAVSSADRICYVQAEQSRTSVQSLSTHPHAHEVVVYRNTPITDVPGAKFDILIFTSPMNAETYIRHRPVDNSTVIAIGATTQKTLHELGVSRVLTPESPTEQSIMTLLAAILAS